MHCTISITSYYCFINVTNPEIVNSIAKKEGSKKVVPQNISNAYCGAKSAEGLSQEINEL